MIGVYCITNSINGKKYIGQSIDIDRRFKQHKYRLEKNKHHNPHLQNAWNKYGEGGFDFNILKCCKSEYLNRFEKMFIRIYDSFENGYNQTIGGESLFGENNPMYGKSLSEETRRKMSEAKTGEKHFMYGKHHLDKSKIKMSEARNTSGYFRVSKHKKHDCKQGYIFMYYYYDENNKKNAISSVSITELENKVKAKGLEWRKIKGDDL